ncbi:MAG: hypothetical protein ACLPKE_02590, partial [Streptosporangiaceae bacterium]
MEPDDELMQAMMGRLGETSGFSATLRLTCPADSHQDRATDDHAERAGAMAPSPQPSADVTFCSAPACHLTIRIRR